MEGETEPAESKLDKWFEEHATPAVQNVLMTCAAFVGVVLALFLFTFLPTFLTGLVMKLVPLGRWPRVILEGALKMAIFLGYMSARGSRTCTASLSTTVPSTKPSPVMRQVCR